MTKTQTLVAVPAMVLTLLVGGALAGYATLASAQTATGTAQNIQGGPRMGRPGVHGTVTAVSGSMITLKDDRSGTTYSIDASAATFKKMGEGAAPTSETLADIAVGDEVSARGTLSGTTLIATEVIEGAFFGRGPGHGRGHGIAGTVSAINGSTITLTGKDGQTYTVNAGSATVSKMTSESVSDIVLGSTIGVEGSVSGTTVTANHIMDGIPADAPQQPRGAQQ